jgi:hypothetical protein
MRTSKRNKQSISIAKLKPSSFFGWQQLFSYKCADYYCSVVIVVVVVVRAFPLTYSLVFSGGLVTLIDATRSVCEFLHNKTSVNSIGRKKSFTEWVGRRLEPFLKNARVRFPLSHSGFFLPVLTKKREKWPNVHSSSFIVPPNKTCVCRLFFSISPK